MQYEAIDSFFRYKFIQIYMSSEKILKHFPLTLTTDWLLVSDRQIDQIKSLFIDK